VPELPVVTDYKAVEATWRPRGHTDAVGAKAAETLPGFPAVAIPVAVPHCVVTTDGKHIDAIRSPRDRGRIRVDVPRSV